MSAIPNSEIDLFINTIDDAVALAAEGRVVDGHAALYYGLQRAEAARHDGEPWGEELVTDFRLALDNYCESYGVRLA